MAVELVTTLNLTPSVVTDAYELNTLAELEGSDANLIKGNSLLGTNQYTLKTALTTATVVGVTTTLAVSNGYITKATDTITITTTAGTETKTVSSVTATTIVISSATAYAHPTAGSVVTANKITANYSSGKYSKFSTIYSPRININALAKAVNITPTKTVSTGNDLMVLARSGSTEVVDTETLIDTCIDSTQAEFEAGTKSSCYSALTNELRPGHRISTAEANLVALWRMDNSWADAKGGHTLTAYNGATFTTNAKIETHAALFDGAATSGDYAMCGDSADWDFGSGNFTIEFWVYHTKAIGSNEDYIAYISNGASIISYLIRRNPAGKLFIVLSSDGTNANFIQETTETITSNAWHHIAIVRDGNVIKPYIGGALATIATNTYTSALSSSPTELRLADEYNATWSTNLGGYLDQVAIYKGRALTASEIQARGSNTSTFESSIIDLGSSFDVDSIILSSTINSGTSISVSVRGGNVAIPDGSWSSYTTATNFTTVGDYKVLLASQATIAYRYWQYKIIGSTNGTGAWAIRAVNLLLQPSNYTKCVDITTSATNSQNLALNKYLQCILLGATNEIVTWELDKVMANIKYHLIDLYNATHTPNRVTLTKRVEFKTDDIVSMVDKSISESSYDKSTFVNLSVTQDVFTTPDTWYYEAANQESAGAFRANIVAATPATPTVNVYAKNTTGVYHQMLKDDGITECPSTGTGQDFIYSENVASFSITEVANDGIFTPSASPWRKRYIKANGGISLAGITLKILNAGAKWIQASTDDVNWTTFADNGSVTMAIPDVAAGSSQVIYLRVKSEGAGSPDLGDKQLDYDIRYSIGI